MAIAFDTVTDGGSVNPGTSLTWSHTCTGSNRILFVEGSNITSTDPNMTCTYAGIPMNLVNKKLATNAWQYLFSLVNPPSGANNVVLSFSSDAVGASSISYTGVAQGTEPEANSTNSTASANNITGTVNTVTNNAWTLIVARAEAGGTMSAGAGTTARGVKSAVNSLFGDSNGGITPTGSTTLNIASTLTGAWACVICTFGQFQAGGSNLSTMGVG